MKKGLVIALIAGGVLLAACGAFYPFSSFARTTVNRGFGLFDSRDGMLNERYSSRWSTMPQGMHGGYRSDFSREDFYLERWSYMLGIPEEELQQRLDDGESLDDIMESLDLEMPCEEFYEENIESTDASPSAWNETWEEKPFGMCF